MRLAALQQVAPSPPLPQPPSYPHPSVPLRSPLPLAPLPRPRTLPRPPRLSLTSSYSRPRLPLTRCLSLPLPRLRRPPSSLRARPLLSRSHSPSPRSSIPPPIPGRPYSLPLLRSFSVLPLSLFILFPDPLLSSSTATPATSSVFSSPTHTATPTPPSTTGPTLASSVQPPAKPKPSEKKPAEPPKKPSAKQEAVRTFSTSLQRTYPPDFAA